MDILTPLNPTDLLTSRGDGNLEALQTRLQKNGKKSEREMQEAAGQFETMMIRQILKEMRKTVPKEGFDEESHATEMYTEIADDYLAQQLGASKSFGIADLIYADLKKQNEKTVAPSELKKNSAFLKLPTRADGSQQMQFIPLQPDTEKFMALQRSANKYELPQKQPEFKELQKRQWIPSDKLSTP